MSWVSRIFNKTGRTDDAMPVNMLGDGIVAMGDGDFQPSQAYAARDAYWDRIGVSDPDLISYAINPELLSAPAWPGTRQAFRIVRTGDSLVIASEGLSDPFPQEHVKGAAANCGLGLEVIMELPGWQRKSIDDIQNSWAFSALEMFAQNTASSDDILDRLNQYGIMSIELPFSHGLEGWTNSGRIGALIDVPIMADYRVIPGLPGGGARVVPLSIIRAEELAFCVAGGAQSRRALAKALIQEGFGHRVEIDRKSLR